MLSRPPAVTEDPRPARYMRAAAGLAAASVAVSIWAAAGLTREPPLVTSPPIAVDVGEGGEGHVTIAAGTPPWKALRFGAVTAATTRWSDPVPARVKVDEARVSRVGAPLAGRVTQIFVELGQPVKRGDALFTLASADIAGLRAERERARVDRDAARARLDHVKAMVAASALAAKDEVEAEKRHRLAEVALRLAHSKVTSLQRSPRADADHELTVVSPRDGVVLAKSVLPSQQVGVEGGLVDVADLAQVWAVAELFEADANGIATGTPVEVRLPSRPDLVLEARVDMVASVVDPVRHTLPVRVRLDNTQGLLRPNVRAQMRFAVPPRPGSGEVAASAIVSDGARQHVFVQAELGRLARRLVVAGSPREGRAPIFSGLQPGEIVVEEGAILLDNQVTIVR